MKVVQIVDDIHSVGGVNSFVVELCLELHNQGIEVYLIGLLKAQGKESTLISVLRNAGIPIFELSAKTKVDSIFGYIGKLRKIIRKIAETDTVICNLHLKLSVLMGTVASLGLENVICVETYHNMYKNYHLQCWCMSLFMKHYICVSKAAKEEMCRRFSINPTRISVVANGISRKRVRDLVPEKERTLFSSTKEVNILSVGRLSFEKNFVVPIKSILNMKEFSLKYRIVGDGPQMGVIKDLASLTDNIEVLGERCRTDTIKLIANSDIILMPSLWEGRSIFQLEAMAWDKPLIISDVKGLREPFEEEKLANEELFRVCSFGYLVHTNNEDSYAAAIKHYITHRERHDSIAQYIREISIRNDISSVSKGYIEIYNKALE